MKDPDLVFKMSGLPPRKTHQGGVRYCRDDGAPGGVRVFTDEAHRLEAWEMRYEFERQLPAGWVPSRDPAEVEVFLIYAAREEDRLAGEALVPHVQTPDADNLVKSILDAMARAGVFRNDAQVFDLRVRKFRGEVPGWFVRVKFGGYGFAGRVRLRMIEFREWLRRARAESRARRRKKEEDGVGGGLFG